MKILFGRVFFQLAVLLRYVPFCLPHWEHSESDTAKPDDTLKKAVGISNFTCLIPTAMLITPKISIAHTGFFQVTA